MVEKMSIGMGDLYICDLQGDIFRSYADEGYDMGAFTRWYLNMDPDRPDWSTVDELPRRSDDAGYDADAAEWIGFSYSYLTLRTGKTGAELLRCAPFEWMLKAYAKLCCVIEDLAVKSLMDMLSVRESIMNNNSN